MHALTVVTNNKKPFLIEPGIYQVFTVGIYLSYFSRVKSTAAASLSAAGYVLKQDTVFIGIIHQDACSFFTARESEVCKPPCPDNERSLLRASTPSEIIAHGIYIGDCSTGACSLSACSRPYFIASGTMILRFSECEFSSGSHIVEVIDRSLVGGQGYI